jgi:hypothetical protein
MKKNQYISLSSDSPALKRFRYEYTNQHSKFIHASWLIKEDLDREVEMYGVKYTIFGLWDMSSGKYTILLKNMEGGAYLIANSKDVANALGYVRMRNLVTGKEYTSDLVPSKGLVFSGPPPVTVIDEDIEDEDTDEDTDDEDYIDPLVKALQDDITDDGDSSAL